MGRKVNPIGFRLGIIKEHKSRWFAAGKQYTEQLVEDRAIRTMVVEALNKDDRPSRDSRQSSKNKAGISNVEIERQPNQVHVIIDTARPGVIIGRKGASVNLLRQQLPHPIKDQVSFHQKRRNIAAKQSADRPDYQLEHEWIAAKAPCKGRRIARGADQIVFCQQHAAGVLGQPGHTQPAHGRARPLQRCQFRGLLAAFGLPGW